MRIHDVLYFAPGIRFGEVDWEGPRLLQQFKDRIVGLYIRPAEECAERGHAFAAGVLLVSCIDALARLRFGSGVGDRFKRFAREQLKSFATEDIAKRFYDDFRNGLSHEARIKKGGQFSLDISSTVEHLDGRLLVNPRLLAKEVCLALGRYIDLLGSDEAERTKFARTIRQDHAMDSDAAG